MISAFSPIVNYFRATGEAQANNTSVCELVKKEAEFKQHYNFLRAHDFYQELCKLAARSTLFLLGGLLLHNK